MRAALPGGDGWISLVPADLAPLLLPESLAVPDGATPILDQLAGGQALFFRGLSDLVGATDDTGAGRSRVGPGLGRAAHE